MNTLSKHRILEQGDQFYNGTGWVPIPPADFGMQVMFTKYEQVRRPSEKPPKDLPAPVLAEPELPSNRETNPAQAREKQRCDAPDSHITGQDSRGGQTPPVLRETPETARPTEAPKLARCCPAKEWEMVPATKADLAKATKGGRNLTIRFPIYPEEENPPDCIWTGRNGTFHAKAVNLFRNENMVSIVPVGKRRLACNCIIQFPVSIIPQLTDWLIQQELEKE